MLESLRAFAARILERLRHIDAVFNCAVFLEITLAKGQPAMAADNFRFFDEQTLANRNRSLRVGDLRAVVLFQLRFGRERFFATAEK